VTVDSIAPAIQTRCQPGFAFRLRLVGPIVEALVNPIASRIESFVPSVAPKVKTFIESIASSIETLVHPVTSGVESLVDSIAEPIPESVSRKNRSRDCDRRRGECTQ
jgi:phage-related protein